MAMKPLSGHVASFRTEIDLSGLHLPLERHSQRSGNRKLTQPLMFRISSHVRSTPTQDGSILLHIHHGQMFSLNLVGSKILELLERGYDEARIAEVISNTYGVDRDIAIGNVREFVEALYRHHILEPLRSNSCS
jgi:Coenzyme PQQ synthesis protein D (PqqD)